MTMFKYSAEARRIIFRSRMKELQVENDTRNQTGAFPGCQTTDFPTRILFHCKTARSTRLSGDFNRKG